MYLRMAAEYGITIMLYPDRRLYHWTFLCPRFNGAVPLERAAWWPNDSVTCPTSYGCPEPHRIRSSMRAWTRCRASRKASKRDPACDTTPIPSALTVIFGRVAVAFHLETAFLLGESGLSASPVSQPDRHFRSSNSRHAAKITKSRS